MTDAGGGIAIERLDADGLRATIEWIHAERAAPDALRRFVAGHCVAAAAAEISVRDIEAALQRWDGFPFVVAGLDLAALLGAAGFRVLHRRIAGAPCAAVTGWRWRGPGDGARG